MFRAEGALGRVVLLVCSTPFLPPAMWPMQLQQFKELGLPHLNTPTFTFTSIHNYFTCIC